MNGKHQVGDPVFWLKEGTFGYISQIHFDINFNECSYIIAWFIEGEEVESAWLDESIVDNSKRDLAIYLGEIPPTSVR